MTDSAGTQRPMFVVSSGRSGSTLLARMINRHPQILCVSDLFEPVGQVPYFDRQRIVDGEEFLAVLSRPSFQQRIDYWRERPNAELLFLHEDDDMVSLLLSYTLPFLTGGDPMEFYGEMADTVRGFGAGSMADHMIRLFDWLRDCLGKELWVERTGGSLPHMARIIDTWPDAKIVHNYRDPRETALSMMSGSFFRLYLELEKNPDLGEWDFDYMPPIEEMGAMLNRWFVDGLAAFEALPADRRMSVAYEELMADAEGTLLRLAGFFLDRSEPSAAEVAWAKQEAAIIRPAPLRFPALGPEEREKLEVACAESLQALGYPVHRPDHQHPEHP